MSDTPIELKEIKPIGRFLLDSGKGAQTSTGCFYHYSDVCVLLRKFADRENAKLESELAEARAEIERLNKNMRLLLCEKCRAKCEGGLFNSKYPEDEPCLICELKKAEK